MKDPILRMGMHLKNNQDGEEYRIIYLSSDMAVICFINTSKLILEYRSTVLLLQMLGNGMLSEIQDQEYIIDINLLEETKRNLFLQNKEMMNKVVELYGPTYMELKGKGSKPDIEKLIDVYNISKPIFWKRVRKYLQSGMNDKSLLDQRYFNEGKGLSYTKKPGRKNKNSKVGKLLEDVEFINFKKYTELYLRNKSMTIESAYIQLIADCYRERRVNDDGSVVYITKKENERPSYNQFYYYLKKNTSLEQRDKAKMGAMEQRNNQRLLLGNAKTDVYGVCDLVEIDACEINIALVSSEYPEKAVGRPILYLMVDVSTRLILATAVAMDNNSVVGLTNCFANLVEDKHALCAKYGISFDNDSIWPSNYKPTAIRVDRGSDFISKDIHRFGKEFGIRIDTVSGGTGSLKSIVERMFRDIHDKQNEFLEKKGLITKRYNSNHHKEACLSIDEYTAILLNYVLYHNQSYMQKYIKTPEMIKSGIAPIPAVLWEYGCKNGKAPKIIANKEQFLYGLMIPKKAKVSRRGIEFEGLYYLNLDDEDMMNLMYKQQGKVTNIDIRYDPRNIERIYYLKNGKLQSAILNPAYQEYEGYRGICYKHLKELQKMAKEMDTAGREMNRQNRAHLNDCNKAIINSVEKVRYTDVANLKENRKVEKERISQEHSFSKKLGLDIKEDSEAIKIELLDRKKEQQIVVQSILEDKKDMKKNELDNKIIIAQEMLDIMLEDD